jgi:hypothetical protein
MNSWGDKFRVTIWGESHGQQVGVSIDGVPAGIALQEDDFLYDQLQDYRKWLEQNHLEYTYYESTGGHTWTNWQDYLCRFLKQIF